MENVVNSDASVLYFADTEAIASVKNPVKKDPDGNMEVAYWDDDNNFPQAIDAIIRKNADFGSMLDFKSGMLYSGGIHYKVKKINKTDGSFEYVQKHLPEVDKFLKRNWNYPMQAVNDIFRYINIFPRFQFANEKIHWLTCQPAGHCRLSKQKPDGTIPNIYVSANWDEIENTKDKTVSKYPLIPHITGDADWIKAHRKKEKVLMWHLAMPTGKTYYQLAHWYGIVESKWLDLANEIPKFKLAIMQNQVTIKYHIQMPDYWMSWKYKDWDKKTAKQQAELQEEEFKYFNDFLKGSEKAGKSIVSTFRTDKHTKQAWPGWSITPIDDKIKDGLYLEDSTEATMKMFASIGLDPALFGVVPGKGGSNRSGSDKREAMNIAISFLQRQADLVLKPYEVVADFNGWNTDTEIVEFEFNKPYLQTLDQVTPSQRETTSPTEE